MSIEYLDDEEKEIIEAYDGIELKDITAVSSEVQKQFREAARSYLSKETKMNIRINAGELEKIRELAAQEGLKYQTFIKSIIHKYITGQLVDKRKAG